jgi:hypothetical protein
VKFISLTWQTVTIPSYFSNWQFKSSAIEGATYGSIIRQQQQNKNQDTGCMQKLKIKLHNRKG